MIIVHNLIIVQNQKERRTSISRDIIIEWSGLRLSIHQGTSYITFMWFLKARALVTHWSVNESMTSRV